MTSLKRLVCLDGDIDLVVDVANVSREERLGGKYRPSWRALVEIVTAWGDRFGTPRVVLACDRGLDFGEHQDEFEQLARWGAAARPWPLVLTGLHDADPVILKIAAETGASVLSRDRFLDHRRDHPWIGGTADRVFSWQVADTGRVEIVARRMLVTGEFTMSEAEQARADKRRGLRDDVLDEALRWHFRCTTDGCVLRERFPARLRDLPIARNGRLICPQCKRPVQRLERRRVSRAVKLSAGSRAVRVGVEAGDSIVVGRDERGLANRVLSPGDLRKISSRHLRISFDGKDVVVTDLGSTNGTVIETWSARDRERRAAVDLRAGDPVVLRPNDHVTLAGVVQVALSGHRAPRARPLIRQQAGKPAEDVSETVHL
jgi:hypothetical protein